MLRSDFKPSDCSIVRTITIADLECLTKNINDHRQLQTHLWQDTTTVQQTAQLLQVNV